MTYYYTVVTGTTTVLGCQFPRFALKLSGIASRYTCQVLASRHCRRSSNCCVSTFQYRNCHATSMQSMQRRCNVTGLNYQKSHHALFAATSYLNGYTTRFASNQTPSTPASTVSDAGAAVSADPSVAANTPEYVLEAPDLTIPAEQLTALGEPTLTSLGLAGWYPTGWIQQILETIHVYGELSWFTTIIVYVLFLRTAMIPLQIYSRKIAITQGNIMPEYNKLYNALADAESRGDTISANLKKIQLDEFTEKYKPDVKKQILSSSYAPLILIANMMALSSMACLPVESLQSGGLFWITDLTIPDPLFILPVITSLTFLATLELGAEGISTQTTSEIVKWFLRSFAGVSAVFVTSQPALLGVYWLTSNMLALMLMCVYKIPYIEKMLNMPKMKVNDKKTSKKGEKTIFSKVKNLKQTMKKNTQSGLLQVGREQKGVTNARAFKDAARSNTTKTFDYDPTKVAKKRRRT